MAAYFTVTSTHDRFSRDAQVSSSAWGTIREGGEVVTTTFASGTTVPVPGVSPSPSHQDFWYGSGQYQLNLTGATASSLPANHTLTISRSGATSVVLTSSGTASVGDDDSWTWRWRTSRISGGSGDYTLEYEAPPTFEFDPASVSAHLVNNLTETVTLATATANAVPGAGTITYSIHGTAQQGISVNASNGQIYYAGNASNNAALPAVNSTFTVEITANNGSSNTINRFVLTVTVHADESPEFGTATISARTFTQNEAITAFTLPAATGGNAPLTYRVTPSLPAGLTLTGRTVSGTPTAAQVMTSYQWIATDNDGDQDSLLFYIQVNSPAALTTARSVWRTPRTWEGKIGSGDDADHLGEWDTDNGYGQKIEYSPNLNVYDLTYEWSEPLMRTMPAIATARGQMIIGEGTNELTTLAVGTGGQLRVNSGGTAMYWDTSGHVFDTGYPTTAQSDLVVGNSSGRPDRFARPTASGDHILVSNGPGSTPGWEKIEQGQLDGNEYGS